MAESLRELLRFLAGPGQTEANTWFVDLFLNEDKTWEAEWADFPEPIHDIVADMASALHDTVTAPHIARNVDSTPGQLLARLKHALLSQSHNW